MIQFCFDQNMFDYMSRSYIKVTGLRDLETHCSVFKIMYFYTLKQNFSALCARYTLSNKKNLCIFSENTRIYISKFKSMEEGEFVNLTSAVTSPSVFCSVRCKKHPWAYMEGSLAQHSYRGNHEQGGKSTTPVYFLWSHNKLHFFIPVFLNFTD